MALLVSYDGAYDFDVHFREGRDPRDLSGHLGPVMEFGSIVPEPGPSGATLSLIIRVDLVASDERAGLGLPTAADRPHARGPSHNPGERHPSCVSV